MLILMCMIEREKSINKKRNFPISKARASRPVRATLYLIAICLSINDVLYCVVSISERELCRIIVEVLEAPHTSFGSSPSIFCWRYTRLLHIIYFPPCRPPPTALITLSYNNIYINIPEKTN